MRNLLPDAFLVLLLLAGCTTSPVRQAYPGPPLPVEKTCTLLVPGVLDLLAVDGTPTGLPVLFKAYEQDRLSLPSGHHVLWVRYYDPTYNEALHDPYLLGPIAIVIDTHAGDQYRLCYRTYVEDPELYFTRDHLRVWAEEVRSPR